MPQNFLIVPGLGNSGPLHWQTFWENGAPDKFRRIIQTEWDTPRRDDWIAKIEGEVRKSDVDNVILLAHSLGCTAVAHWARVYGTKIKGAFLVAPSDCEAASYTFDTEGFAPIPLDPLPFRSIVVASTNDEYVSFERAKFFADAWGSEFVGIGDAGHINANSGHGEWPEGLELLKSL